MKLYPSQKVSQKRNVLQCLQISAIVGASHVFNRFGNLTTV
jgi:hypothetical protein